MSSRYSATLPLGNIQEIQLDNEKFLAEDEMNRERDTDERLCIPGFASTASCA